MTSVFKSIEGRRAIMEEYEGIVAEWPVAHNRLTIETSFGATHVIQCGNSEGEPLVLLHGTSGNSSAWMGDVEKWSKKYNVFAVDIPGEPGLSADRRLGLAAGVTTKWLSEVVGRLGEPVHLIGMSLGGFIATRFAIDAPKSARSLTLIASSGFAPQRMGFLLKAAVLSLFGDWGVKRVWNSVCYKTKIPPRAMAFGMLVSKHFIPVKEIVPIFTDTELNRLRAQETPILYFGGKHDVMLRTEETATRILSHVPASAVYVLDDSGHVVLGVADSISAFLADVSKNHGDKNRSGPNVPVLGKSSNDVMSPWRLSEF